MSLRATGALRPSESRVLLALLAFTLAAVTGYWNFALHPERLPGSALAARFFATSFEFFAQVHILVTAAALGTLLIGRAGLRWVPAFLVVAAVSFAAEHVGTRYAVPFGGYAYTGLLGPKLGGRVPALIPVSWFLMAVPSWILARHAAPGSGRRAAAARLALGAAWMVTWDLALDPAMSFLTPYWRWEEAGPYYGMPLLNLLGWGVTALALVAALESLGDRTGIGSLPVAWVGRYYAVVLLMPLGMVTVAGLWPATLATIAAAGSLGALTLRAARSRASDPAPPSDASMAMVAAR